MCDYRRLEQKMAQAGLDSLMALGPSNAMYLTGHFDNERSWRSPQGLANLIPVITFPDRSFVVGGLGEDLALEAENIGGDTSLDARLIMVAEQLKARGLERGRIGIDLQQTPVSNLDRLRGLLPQARFVAADVLLAQVRAVKTPAEVECLRQASAISEAALRSVIETFPFAPGVSYADLSTAWAKAVLERGAYPMLGLPFDLMAQRTFASGPKNAAPSPVSPEGFSRGPDVMQPGVVTRLGLCVTYRGYYSDQKFIICLGQPSEAALPVIQAHRARQEFMQLMLRPGLTKAEAFQTCIDTFNGDPGKYGSVQDFGFWLHSIGLDCHEEPKIGANLPHNATVMPEVTFELGTVVNLEGSWMVVDTYFIEESGVTCLGSGLTRELISIPV